MFEVWNENKTDAAISVQKAGTMSFYETDIP